MIALSGKIVCMCNAARCNSPKSSTGSDRIGIVGIDGNSRQKRGIVDGDIDWTDGLERGLRASLRFS